MRLLSDAREALFVEMYPNSTMAEMRNEFGLKNHQIYNIAFRIGLKKTEAYLQKHGCRFSDGSHPNAVRNRFEKGHKSFNKGRKQTEYMTQEAIDRTKATRFVKGQRPPNWRPVGSTRINLDGYKEIKVCEGKGKYKLFHRVLWERMNGSIDKNKVLVFRDGDKTNFSITNLELITKKENMQRNTVHNLPKELALVVQLQGQLNRQINRRIANG